MSPPAHIPHSRHFHWSINKVLLILAGASLLSSEIWGACWEGWQIRWLRLALGLALMTAGVTLANPFRFSWAGRLGALFFGGIAGWVLFEQLPVCLEEASCDWGRPLALFLLAVACVGYSIFGSHPRILSLVVLLGSSDDFWDNDLDWD